MAKFAPGDMVAVGHYTTVYEVIVVDTVAQPPVYKLSDPKSLSYSPFWVGEDELTLVCLPQPGLTGVAQWIPPPTTQSVPAAATSVRWKIGDTAKFYDSKVKIVKVSWDYGGTAHYQVESQHGNVFGANEADLLFWYTTTESSKSTANGCECGAHATSWPDDHMHFCPKFKGVK